MEIWVRPRKENTKRNKTRCGVLQAAGGESREDTPSGLGTTGDEDAMAMLLSYAGVTEQRGRWE